MPDLILHHYEMSPFSEKVRRILAWKRLPWTAVRAPAVMPKPDLVALTGGYRRVPVLQIGNHVYCDTALIGRVLDRLSPEPALFPTPVAESLSEWADTKLFEAAAVVAMRPTRLEDSLRWMTQEELSKVVEDRKAMRTDARIKPLSREAAESQLVVWLTRLDVQTAAQPFLLGEQPTGVDFAAYASAWFLERMRPEPLVPFPHLRRWMERLAEPRTEPRETISADAALRVASAAPREVGSLTGSSAAYRIPLGSHVIVRATDYGRDPVEGELVQDSFDEVAVKRQDPRAGTVFVHFPKIGYEVVPPA